MRVGVDVDDVLFPWYDRAHVLCEAAGITNGVQPSTWSPHLEYGVELQVWLDVLEAATLDGTLYQGEPYPDVVEALGMLKAAGHTIHLVTARGFLALGWVIREHTVNWLEGYQVPHDTLTFAKDKTMLLVDAFADDAVHNVEALRAAGIPTCMIHAPHNAAGRTGWQARTFVDFAEQILNGSGVL